MFPSTPTLGIVRVRLDQRNSVEHAGVLVSLESFFVVRGGTKPIIPYIICNLHHKSRGNTLYEGNTLLASYRTTALVIPILDLTGSPPVLLRTKTTVTAESRDCTMPTILNCVVGANSLVVRVLSTMYGVK